MKTIALISGGKDSLLSVLAAYRHGHEAVVLANLAPADCDRYGGDRDGVSDVYEIDSFMFQTVGHEVITEVASCLQLPLRRATVAAGSSRDKTLRYSGELHPDDEVEAMYRLLKSITEEFPEVRGVTTGAILSNYQRYRVENVCARLGLISLAYLWQCKPNEILDMMEALRMRAILVKTASIGLSPRTHLGQDLLDVRPTLEKLESLYGVHSAGEGGEFETIVLDCPLFATDYLEVKSMTPVVVDDNEYAPSGHAVLRVQRRTKSPTQMEDAKNILSVLRDASGELMFPSNRMKDLPIIGSSLFHDQVKWPSCTTSAFGSTWEEQTSEHFISDQEVTSPEEMQVAATALLQHAALFLAETKREVYAVLVSLPNLRLVEAFNDQWSVFTRTIPAPCGTVVGRGEATGYLVMDVLHVACFSGGEREILHVQSRSCWASGRVGPYAQANLVTLSQMGQCSLYVGAVSGTVPVTWEMAVPSDVAGLTANKECFPCEDPVFAAQFCYAYANALAYCRSFGRTVENITHATFLVACEMTLCAHGIPALWQACSSRPLDSVKHRLHEVNSLEGGAAIQLILECCDAVECGS